MRSVWLERCSDRPGGGEATTIFTDGFLGEFGVAIFRRGSWLGARGIGSWDEGMGDHARVVAREGEIVMFVGGALSTRLRPVQNWNLDR